MKDAAKNICAEIQAQISNLAKKIGAPEGALPPCDASVEGIHIEIGDAYHWVFVERGMETRRKTTYDLDEFLYWIFSSVADAMAMQYARDHSIDGEDFRRVLFGKRLDLLGRMSDEWRKKEEKVIADILARHPFQDSRLS